MQMRIQTQYLWGLVIVEIAYLLDLENSNKIESIWWPDKSLMPQVFWSQFPTVSGTGAPEVIKQLANGASPQVFRREYMLFFQAECKDRKCT